MLTVYREISKRWRSPILTVLPKKTLIFRGNSNRGKNWYYYPEFYRDYTKIPVGTYTFTVTDFDTNTAQVTDELTVVNPLPLVTDYSPADNSETSVRPWITWDPVDGAAKYEVRIYNAQGHEQIHTSGFLTGTEYLVPAGILTPNTDYSYRILAYRESGSDVDVKNPSVGWQPKHFTTALPLTTISSFTPTSGSSGISVTITGTNFTGATSVTFGGTEAGNFTVVSATEITAQVGSGSTGQIAVTTPGGKATSAGTFTYRLPSPTITDFAPTSGVTGSSIIIRGKYLSGSTAAQFGSAAAQSFTVNSDTRITAVVGSGSTGKISVTAPGGTATSAQLFIYLTAKPGGGVFTDSGQGLGSSYSFEVALGDLDGDGDLDAFVANYKQNKVWLNDGTGAYTDSGQGLGSSYSYGVALGDVDGDGDLDAFVATSNQNKVWLNDGAGAYTDSGQTLGSSFSRNIALGDLDGDGDLDAFVATFNQNKVWLNNGTGVYTDSGQALGSSDSRSVALGDLDGDGDLDAFVPNYNRPSKVWLNDGTGAYTDSGQALGSSYSYGVGLGDVDGDGDLDAFVANYDNQPNKVWLNDGTGAYTDSGQALGSSDSRSVALGDLDGDGDLDAFVPNYNRPSKVWLNDGTGAYTDSGQALGSSYSYGVGLGDLDGRRRP